MNLTIDQLSYVLERKFNNLTFGLHANVSCTVTTLEDGALQMNNDASIAEWLVDGIDKPTESEIEKWWGVLKDQYNADPDRVDSDMYKYVHSKVENPITPTVTINTDI